jgi:alpha-tubulin suppressor-like RCC1 family protein
VPTDLKNVIAVSSGRTHTAALNELSRLICWGSYSADQCLMPTGLEHVVAVHCGDEVTCALTQEGKLVCWGDNEYGQCNVPQDLVVMMCGNILL